MNRAPAPAKINLALVVGPLRPDGKHEVATVLQRVDLGDRVAVEPAATRRVRGFADDTLVAAALAALASAVADGGSWEARIWKRIPVAAGLGGGSSDAATALKLANRLVARPLDTDALAKLARTLGADVPFFLRDGPQLGTGDGSVLEPLDLPQDFWVVLVVPSGVRKSSTAEVYRRFDEDGRASGYDERRAALVAALERVRRPRDLAAMPANDLASSRLAGELMRRGAFRADVSGAGPAVYGLFARRADAEAARTALARHGRTWLSVPTWYG